MLTLLLVALALRPDAHPSCHCRAHVRHAPYTWTTVIREPGFVATQTCTARWRKSTTCTVTFKF